MALMLTLDDAMNVLIRGGYLDEGYISVDGEAECVRSELEQKCYSIAKSESNSWFDEVRRDIEYVTSVDEIGRHLVAGDLGGWLETCRDNIIGELTLAAGGDADG